MFYFNIIINSYIIYFWNLWRIKRMSKDEYLITDTPLKALTIFAMPMILGSFFQQVYNMADSIIVGQFVGSSALAAVGA